MPNATRCSLKRVASSWKSKQNEQKTRLSAASSLNISHFYNMKLLVLSIELQSWLVPTLKGWEYIRNGRWYRGILGFARFRKRPITGTWRIYNKRCTTLSVINIPEDVETERSRRPNIRPSLDNLDYESASSCLLCLGNVVKGKLCIDIIIARPENVSTNDPTKYEVRKSYFFPLREKTRLVSWSTSKD